MLQRLLSFCRRFFGGSSSPSADSAGDERRVWVRYPSSTETVVQPILNGTDTRLSARVQNVSRGGVRLRVNRQFDAGDMIAIELPGGSVARVATVLACVVHVLPAGPGQWALGCTV